MNHLQDHFLSKTPRWSNQWICKVSYPMSPLKSNFKTIFQEFNWLNELCALVYLNSECAVSSKFHQQIAISRPSSKMNFTDSRRSVPGDLKSDCSKSLSPLLPFSDLPFQDMCQCITLLPERHYVPENLRNVVQSLSQVAMQSVLPFQEHLVSITLLIQRALFPQRLEQWLYRVYILSVTIFKVLLYKVLPV